MARTSWFNSLLFASSSLIHSSAAGGIIGYGIERWSPRCPYICRFTLSASPLTCSKTVGTKTSTSQDCYASNEPFLESLAWCLSTRCQGLELWEYEQWWAIAESGNSSVIPKLSYAQALAKVPTKPNATVIMKKALNVTSLTRDFDYQITWNTYGENESSETASSRYAIVLICTGLLIPIAFSLLRFLPLPKQVMSKAYGYLILPATWGDKHRTPLPLNIGNCPTRGQALLVFYLVVLNILMCFASYRLVPVALQTKYATRQRQIAEIMANRIAVLCMGNLALTVLYSSRNNFLIWITKWQRSTFLLIHHWLGYIVIFEAVVHASLYLHGYLIGMSGDYSTEHKLPYWKWATVAIVCISAIGPLSILPIRQKFYEIFRMTHNILACLILIGIYMHAFLKNGAKGFHNWIYASLAVLAFDRVARVFRIARNGVRTAEVTIIDDDYVRVDVRGVTAEGHAYIYFPTLTWRIWENHPFSVAASVHNVTTEGTITSSTLAGMSTPRTIEKGDSNPQNSLAGDSEKNLTTDTIVAISAPEDDGRSFSESATSPLRPVAGVTFFVRRQHGMTVLLSSRIRLPVFIESSYGSLSDLAYYPNLISIAGGVGIVTCLPVMRSHPGRSKLYWSMRNATLFEALRDDVSMFDKEIAIGKRLDIAEILEKEIAGESGKGACVVVSGPGSLADEVRKMVCEIGRRKGSYPVKFVDESFN